MCVCIHVKKTILPSLPPSPQKGRREKREGERGGGRESGRRDVSWSPSLFWALLIISPSTLELGRTRRRTRRRTKASNNSIIPQEEEGE